MSLRKIDENMIDDKFTKKVKDLEIQSVDTVQQLADTAKYEVAERSYATLYQQARKKRPLVSFISDDAPVDDWNILKPIIEEKNFPVGLGVITSTINSSGTLSWEQLRKMESLGCEVMAHTHLHRDSRTLTKEVLDEDIKTCRDILRSNGFTPQGFVYPYNSHDDNTKEVIQRYFKYSFSKAPRGGDSTGRNFPEINNQAIGRIALGSYFDPVTEGFPVDTKSLEYYKARVDEALSKGNWLVFVLHTWSPDFNAVQRQHLKDIIDYIRSKGIDIVSPSVGFDIYGNIIQVGKGGSEKFWVDANGKVMNSYNGLEVTDFDYFSVKNSILDFPNRNITLTPISPNFATSEGFPGGKAGFLYTTRLFGPNYTNKQEFVLSSITNVNREKTYERFTDTGYNWTAWRIKGELFYDIDGTATFTVNANSTSDLKINGLPGLRFQDMVTVVPFGTFPAGVLFSLYKTNNDESVTVRFANVTSASIVIPATRWAITCVPR